MVTRGKICKQQISESIGNAIIEEIRNNSLKPGDRLPSLRELAREFGVSVSTIREALRSLEARNIVDFQQGKGVFICENPGIVKEPFGFDLVAYGDPLLLCFEARLAFEPFGAYLAAERATEEDIRAIENAALEMKQLVSQSKPHMSAELEFHAFVARASQNPFIFRIQQAVTAYYGTVTRRHGLSQRLPDQVKKAIRFHELIYEAISKREPERARRLMEEHLRDALADYSKILATSTDET